MEDDDPLKQKQIVIPLDELSENERKKITSRVFQSINLLTPKEPDIQRIRGSNRVLEAGKHQKHVQILHVHPSLKENSIHSKDNFADISSLASSSADRIGIQTIKEKPDRSLPRRKTPAEVFTHCPSEIKFLFGLYEIFIEQTKEYNKPTRSMIPYKVRTPGEFIHPSLNSTLRFKIDSQNYHLLIGGEEKGLGFSSLIHLDSFLASFYDYSGQKIFSILRPLTWITFFFGAVSFGNTMEVRDKNNVVIGRMRQVRDVNITLDIFNVFDERIMAVKTNISVSKCGCVNKENFVIKFYDWDDELLYATLVFKGKYQRKKLLQYERCEESISMLKFDVEVHPLWKICILATFFFLFRNYLEERRPIFMGAGLLLSFLLIILILWIFWFLRSLNMSYTDIGIG